MRSVPTTAELMQADCDAATAATGRHDRPVKFTTPPPHPGETFFRHSGWTARRRQVRAALATANLPWSRIERFDSCGACGVIEHSRERDTFRLTAFFCHDRWCQPCANARAHMLRRQILNVADPERLRFVTLTLRHVEAPLADQLRKLRTAWMRLRKTAFWKSCTTGGVAVTELKTGEDGLWHVHLHVITEGDWMDQRQLSETWKSITLDSHIVDVRALNDPKHAVAYLTKYVTKAVDQKTFADPGRLQEAIIALKGARLHDAYGTWRVPLDDSDANDPNDWTPVTTIVELHAALANAEPWAIALVKRLRRTPWDEKDADTS